METSASILLTPDGNRANWPNETGRPGRHTVETVHLPRRRARRDFNEVGADGDLDGSFYGAVSYVGRRIEKKPTDEAALREIADLFPPSCIFDEHGSVLCDSGAMQHIDAIALEAAKENQGGPARGLPAKIIIKCNRPQPYPPLLSINDPRGAAISVECVRKFDWVFTLEYGRGIAIEGAKLGGACRYCLEIR